jgi:hypothetical protein
MDGCWSSQRAAGAQMPAAQMKTQGRRAVLMCTAHGHGGGHGHVGAATADHGHGHGMGEKPRPGEKKGFVEEMRFVAMKLHTKEQAPKEGKAEVKEEQQQAMKQVCVALPLTRSAWTPDSDAHSCLTYVPPRC